MEKSVYWVGKTPENIKDMCNEEFNDFFAYIYEYYWCEDFVKKHKSVSEYIITLQTRASFLKDDNYKKWWLYLLFIQKDIAKDANYSYLINTVDKIIKNIEDLTLDELELYINNTNSILMGEQIRTPIVRPFEMEKLCGNKALEINQFLYMIEIKDEVIKIIKENVEEDDIAPEYLNNMLIYDTKKTLKFADLITQYTEIFLSYTRTSYEKLEQDPRMIEIKPISKIKIIIDTFFNTSIKEGRGLDIMKKKLTEIIVTTLK